jgi:hypothetical protein
MIDDGQMFSQQMQRHFIALRRKKDKGTDFAYDLHAKSNALSDTKLYVCDNAMGRLHLTKSETRINTDKTAICF